MLLTAPYAAAQSEEPTLPAAPTTGETIFSGSRLIVQWSPAADRSDRLEARHNAEVNGAGNLGGSFQLVVVEPGQTAAEAIQALRSDPTVAIAERDSYSAPTSTPNDPLFATEELWGLRNPGTGIQGFDGAIADADIGAPAGWDRTIGSPSIVIADLDSGYRFDSPDLGPVAWSNSADPPGGGDNDGNGIVNDSRGADFVGVSANSPTTDGDPTDDNLIEGGHGVHTAGTIGAAGDNGAGITGVAQDVRIMPLRVCSYFTDPTPSPDDDSGTLCPTSSQILAIQYAGEHGARVANMSLGGTTPSQAVVNALAQTPQTLFVISAGNDSDNNESVHHYPCDYTPQTQASPPVVGAIDNIVCVAATDQADGLADFSDWGAKSVDLGAPGTEILSTYPLIEERLGEDFEANDFSTSWSNSGAGFGRASPGDGPLTSFGMSDSPGGAPAPNSVHQTTLTTGVPIATGSGACTLRAKRYRSGGEGGSFFYQVLSDDSPIFTNTGSAATSNFAMTTFNTSPISSLGGHEVKVRFGFTAGPTPTATNGIWLDDIELSCYAPLATPPTYDFLDGTSMAAPHVSGAAGLLFSLKPSATVTEVKNALLSSVDSDPALLGKTSSGGRLNLAGALHALMPPAGDQPPDTEITGGPPNSTKATQAVFDFERAGGGPATFECRLVGETAWSSCASPKALAVEVGSHAFQTRAMDGGAIDPLPATHIWTVEPTPFVPPPNPPLISPGAGAAAAPTPGSECTVPKLTGKTLSQAKAALTAAQCAPGKVTKPKAKKGHKLPPLVVRSSKPVAGAKPASGKVDLTLGPKPKPGKHRH